MTGLPPPELPESARELLRKALQREIDPPPAARARVWQGLEKRRSARPRIGWRLGATFVAGAASRSHRRRMKARRRSERTTLRVMP